MTTDDESKGKKKVDAGLSPALLTLGRQDLGKCNFESFTVNDDSLDTEKNGFFKKGETYSCLESVEVDGIVYVVKKLTYNNLRKFARQFLGSGVRNMCKKAILLAIGRLKDNGNLDEENIEDSIEETFRKTQETTMRLINIAFDDDFVLDLLEWYATKDRVGMENGNGAQNERLCLRIANAFYPDVKGQDLMEGDSDVEDSMLIPSDSESEETDGNDKADTVDKYGVVDEFWDCEHLNRIFEPLYFRCRIPNFFTIIPNAISILILHCDAK